MKLIIEGTHQDIRFVSCICREKVRRGQLTLTPAAEAALDADSIATLREALEASEKSCQEMAQGHVELAAATRDVIAIIAEKGITVPEGLAERLAQFGIDVPKEPETVEDNKTVDAGIDMKEVNLDDVKDVEEVDTKAVPAPTEKKPRRSKKSE